MTGDERLTSDRFPRATGLPPPVGAPPASAARQRVVGSLEWLPEALNPAARHARIGPRVRTSDVSIFLRPRIRRAGLGKAPGQALALGGLGLFE